jgi:23S rRNA (adenine-N6)-dimethyltransferase
VPEGQRRGQHFLSADAARRLVDGAGVGPDDLVLDLGAGLGALTFPLAVRAARVVAIERDPKLARRLARRSADLPNVRVHERDIRTMPLPRRPFRVVANLPFAGANAVLRRLLHPSVPLVGADVIVELGCARGWLEDTRWLGRHDLWIAARVSRTSFTPAPSRDAAVLVVRPR